MQAKKLVAFFVLMFLFVPAPSCKPKEEEKPKQGRWIAQYRHPDSTKYDGINLLRAFFYNDISVLSPQVVFVAGDKVNPGFDTRIGVIVATTDGGQNWTEREIRQEGVELLSLNTLHFINQNVGWAAGVDSGYSAVLFKTTDGGASWGMTRPEQKQLPTSIFFADEMTGWMSGATPSLDETSEGTTADLEGAEFTGPSAILATTDGGQTWRAQKQLPVSIDEIYFVDLQQGWACGSAGAIYHTADGGLSWFAQRTDLEPGDGPINLRGDGLREFRVTGIHFADALNGCAAANSDSNKSGRLLMTNDGGKTWQKRWLHDQMEMLDAFFLDANTGWVLTSDGKFVYYTSDGGKNWQTEPKIFEQDVPLNRIEGAGSQNVWAVGGAAIFYRATE
jgi:photosystem II stability/assembly factor-like uncharacterized protein